MRLPCEVMQDILPLYHDGVCSDMTKELAEQHLKECPSCRAALACMDEEFQISEKELDTAKCLASIQNAWRKSKMKAWGKGFFIALVLVALILAGFGVLTQWKCIAVSAEGIEVAEIYQLKDGRILYRLDAPEDVWVRSFQYKTSDEGMDYKVPMRSIIELNKNDGWPSLLNEYQMIDPAENNAWQQNFGNGIEITEWYIGAPGDALLIYETGMELEPAPLELENIYG